MRRLALTLLFFAACDESTVPPSTDAGGRPTWRPPDGAMTYWDANPSVDGGPMRACSNPRPATPISLLPRCYSATQGCLEGCATAADPDACRNACLLGDGFPRTPDGSFGCAECTYLQLFYCLDRQECHAQVGAYFCCIEDRCPTYDPSCVAECQSVAEAMFVCGASYAPECFSYVSGDMRECFSVLDRDAGVPGDAGTSDAGTGGM
jgi:hypothetical protein